MAKPKPRSQNSFFAVTTLSQQVISSIKFRDFPILRIFIKLQDWSWSGCGVNWGFWRGKTQNPKTLTVKIKITQKHCLLLSNMWNLSHPFFDDHNVSLECKMLCYSLWSTSCGKIPKIHIGRISLFGPIMHSSILRTEIFLLPWRIRDWVVQLLV